MAAPNIIDAVKGSSMAGPKKWIKGATQNKGALHRNLGVPEGEKIPAGKLETATHSKNPTIRREAALAETLKGMNHKGRSGKEKRHAMYGAS